MRNRRQLAKACVALLVGLLFSNAGGLPGRAAQADNPALIATVGPGFAISLTSSDGSRVTHLSPGVYTILVHDNAPEHNFRLAGPGFNQATGVTYTGDVTWTATFQD